MNFFRVVALTLMTLLIEPMGVAALEYHDFFFGFSTETLVSSDLSVTPIIPDSLTLETISFAATYGPAPVSWLRPRAGLGWFPGCPLLMFAGLEIPIFELLNQARARMFGIYFIGNVGMTIPLDWRANARIAFQIPVMMLGGLRLNLHRLAPFVRCTGGQLGYVRD